MRFIAVFMAFLLLLGLPTLYAGTQTEGGRHTGDEVVGEFYLKNNEGKTADTLYFTAYNNDHAINGWRITISVFNSSSSAKDGSYEVDAKTWGATVESGDSVETEVKLYTSHGNDWGVNGVYWHTVDKAARGMVKALPDHRWNVTSPVANTEIPGQYVHRFTMHNRDADLQLRVSGLRFLCTMESIHPLHSIVFETDSIYNFTLSSEADSFVVDVMTPGRMLEGHVYFMYDLLDQQGSEVDAHFWGDHPITMRQVPALTEWGLLVLAVLVLASGVWMVIQRRKRAKAHA